MNKHDKLIMVVGRDELFRNDYFQGFRNANEIDYVSRILENLVWMRRADAEINPEYKQPIAYSTIINPILKKVFAYQRSKQDKDYPEKRLQGKWSWGVGGHIEKLDTNSKNPIEASFLRELGEEVEIPEKIQDIRVLGYVNDDKDDVGKVHFGILYVVETDSAEILPKDPEIAEGRLRTLSELEEICSSPDFIIEGWSKIALEPLRTVLS